jgi:hypothetical protein
MSISDMGIIEYYKTEYHKEWYSAWQSGIKLTAKDIRARLGLK